ncbi:hypothetical protein ASPTUDRAFT_37664 [Aspergillus tubingensis CBS 134.48]|uniref:Uncharacterized protein n=1 Tax=Aspergillus tubingensis (strain CBS 134.48) TaxID=767770 RepID=A0A1L9NNL3_ASPTC|nr:hypothetical protein ASPTUDRAFT_37664 [Aspergillus tubingensis CBS 134.48]
MQQVAHTSYIQYQAGSISTIYVVCIVLCYSYTSNIYLDTITYATADCIALPCAQLVSN